MDLRTYQAYSMAEALAAVKRDLGPDAVILNTRSYKRGGILGMGSRTVFELTATAETRAHPAPVAGGSGAPRRGSRPPKRAAQAYADAGSADSAPTDFDKVKTRRLAQALQIQHERRQAAPPAPAATAPAVPPTPKPRPAITAPVRPSIPVTPALVAPAVPAADTTPDTDVVELETALAGAHAAAKSERTPVARRYVLTPAHGEDATEDEAGDALLGDNPLESALGGRLAMMERGAMPAAHSRTESYAAGSVVPPAEPMGTGAVRDELVAIRSMVSSVLQQRVPRPRHEAPDTMPQKLFEVYLTLIGQEMSEELADQIVRDVREALSDEALEDEDQVRAHVRQLLADHVPVAAEALPEKSPDGRPLTIALVGPTGVGKTTTLAKLAASFKLRYGRRVGLVTADTYRIAAVDQLRTYADIIQLPLKVALTPDDMRSAVEELSDHDVILIDTAGRSQNDSGRLQELREFIDAAAPHEVHLVLSGTAGERVLLREAEAFSTVGVHKVVLTKLDEAVSFGMLVDVVQRIGKELSFVTNGQEVPDHIEVVRPDRLASLVLGESVSP